MSSIETFISTVKDLQRTNMYLMTIVPPNRLIDKPGTTLQLLCKSAETPTTKINIKSSNKYGRSYSMATGQTFEDITLNFLLDDDGTILHFFEAWTHLICHKQKNTVQYKDNYVALKMQLDLFDRQNGQAEQKPAASSLKKGFNFASRLAMNYGPPSIAGYGFVGALATSSPSQPKPASSFTYNIINAFPINVSKITMSHGDSELAAIAVTFNYESYTFVSRATPGIPYHNDATTKASEGSSLGGADSSINTVGGLAGTVSGKINEATKFLTTGAGTVTGAIGDVSKVAQGVAGTFPGSKLAQSINKAVTKAGTQSGKLSAQVGGIASRAGSAAGAIELAGDVAEGKTSAGSAVGSLLNLIKK